MLLPASRSLSGSAFAWPAALFVWGAGSWSDVHRHHSVQLVMALNGTLRFRTGRSRRWTTAAAVLVQPDAWHEVDARGTQVLIAFVDAESELGGAFAEHAQSDVAPLASGTIRQWRQQLGDPAALSAARVEPWVTGTLLRRRRPPALDRRVKRVLQLLPTRLADADAVSLNLIAKSVGLSPSRFLHLFTTSVGSPLRPYILWLRLQCAARELLTARRSRTPRTMPASRTRRISRGHSAACWERRRQILGRGLAARDFRM
jgi:AraC-like DNA-binding protein